MTIALYPHQDDFVRRLRGELRRSQSVLAVAPTGMGKTVVAGYMARSASERGKRVIFSVHRTALVTQTAATFDQFGIPYGYIAAGKPVNPYQPVQVASIETLKNRLDRYPADLLVVDEAHLSMAAGWQRVIAHYKASGSRVVGLSGSPMRLDGQALGDNFDAMVEGPTTAWLIENGFLSKYRAFAPSKPDLTGVHSARGDYVTSELQAAMDKPTITGDAVNHWRKHASGKRTIAFAVSVEHSKKVAEQFRASGISAWHMDGETSEGERRSIIAAFADGHIEVLCNCNLMCEGFDLSAQVGRDVPIEAVILLRPTQSLALYLQQVGRGLRRKPQPAVILDHAGNLMRHGLPDDEREWSLAAREKKGRGKSDPDAINVKSCSSCFGVYKPAPRCPYCGAVEDGKPREVQQVDGELEEVDVEAMRRARSAEQAKAGTLDDLVRLGRARGYKSPEKWAAHIYTSRMAKRPEARRYG